MRHGNKAILILALACGAWGMLGGLVWLVGVDWFLIALVVLGGAFILGATCGGASR